MKILCPRHEDTNPSMEVYEDMGFCFVCRAIVPIDELDVDPGIRRESTNIAEMMEYIDGLPLQSIRGLNLPADDRGYYITWPDRDYYKHRFWLGDVRYSGPRGHRPKIFAYKKDHTHLVLVEGEINAMTLKSLYPDHKVTIASFGSAANAKAYIDYYLKFDTIHAIFDKDKVGVAYGLHLRELLQKNKRRVELITMKTDYNDILTTIGAQGVREEAEKQGLGL